MITILATANAMLLLLTAILLLSGNRRDQADNLPLAFDHADEPAPPAIELSEIKTDIEQLKRLVSALGTINSRGPGGGDWGAARLLAGAGMDAQALSTECGLSSAESELLVRCAGLKQSAPTADTSVGSTSPTSGMNRSDEQ